MTLIYVHPTGGWTYYFCFFRCPPSVTLGFQSFQEKVFILSLPNLVWVFTRDGSVSKMCTSGGRQCKTVPIPELRVLVHPNQTWIFPLNDIAIKVPKWTKYERNLYNFFRFLVCSQYFKFSFHFMCCQARFRL